MRLRDVGSAWVMTNWKASGRSAVVHLRSIVQIWQFGNLLPKATAIVHLAGGRVSSVEVTTNEEWD
jgi:hypothetical protein